MSHKLGVKRLAGCATQAVLDNFPGLEKVIRREIAPAVKVVVTNRRVGVMFRQHNLWASTRHFFTDAACVAECGLAGNAFYPRPAESAGFPDFVAMQIKIKGDPQRCLPTDFSDDPDHSDHSEHLYFYYNPHDESIVYLRRISGPGALPMLFECLNGVVP